MTKQRTFKVGDVISIDDVILIDVQYHNAIMCKDDFNSITRSRLLKRYKQQIKLQIVELPEVD